MTFADLLTTYHLFNRFLSTEHGALFKFAVEGIILFLLWYMVTSEYGRDPSKQLKLLVAGFAALFLDATLGTLAYAFAIFAGNDALLPAVLGGGDLLELIGIVLLTNAFLLPVYAWQWVRRKAFIELGTVTALSVLLVAFRLAAPESVLGVFAAFEVVKVALLAATIWLLARQHKEFGRYGRLALIAFTIYAVTPLVNLDNILFFSYTAHRLRVLAQPFPIFAVLLLFRVVYLKLVDKVALQRRLAETTRLYEQERETSKLKDEFVDVVSHELRTPLTSISLYAGLLEKQGLTPKGRKMLTVVRRETKRLGALISDILDLSKLEKGAMRLKRKRVALRTLVEEAALTSLADARGVTLVNKIPAVLTVDVDPDRFAQVVVNLYSNAVKFTPESGTVTFAAAHTKDGFSFSVSDTGIGIPAEEQGRLFDRFFQAGNHLTRSEGGTGLGLAIVKSIVELHGGSITVESEEGQGTTFTVHIPEARAAKRPTKRPGVRSARRSTKRPKRSVKRRTGATTRAAKQGGKHK